MPFQSEKQRRYLHANHPEIAKRWERDYGDGGVAKLNAQLNQLPEYYLPAAKGGIATHFKKRVKLQDSVESMSDEEFKMMYPDWDPTQFSQEDYLQYISENEGNGVLDLSSDDQPIEFASTETDEIIPDLIAPGSASGILKFAKDGGNIRLQPHTATDLLAKKNPDGTRSKYQPPGHRDAPSPSSSGGGGDDEPSWGGGGYDPPSAPVVTQREDQRPEGMPEHLTYTPPKTEYITKKDPPTTGDDKPLLTGPREGWTEEEVKKAVAEGERKAELKRLALQDQREKTEEWEKSKDAPWNQKTHPLKTLGKIATFWVTFGATGLIEVPEIVRIAGTSYTNWKKAEAWYNKYKHLIPEKYGMKDVSLDDIAAKIGGTVKENIEEYKAKQDLINSLPKGHRERILLEESLDYGPYKKTEDRDGDGDEEIPRVEEITEELIEATEEGDAVDIMSVWDRIKNRQAKRSMLVEQGIIQGEPIALANSGGLANLFRVKNQY